MYIIYASYIYLYISQRQKFRPGDIRLSEWVWSRWTGSPPNDDAPAPQTYREIPTTDEEFSVPLLKNHNDQEIRYHQIL